MSNVIPLHQPRPVSHYLRVGLSGHRQLDALSNSGRLPFDSFVFEAATLVRQHDLAGSVAAKGGELILDTNCAELSSLGRFGGAVRAAPWANTDGVLSEEFFKPGGNYDLFGRIARFAVQHGMHVVLAPAHFLIDGAADRWLPIDRNSCIELREALDREGGKDIGIDYPLMIKMGSLRDPIQRRRFITALTELPFDNLWLRVSGFGSGATGVASRRYIAATMEFYDLRRPIVADGVGGLVGLAIAAFGAAGGICHGAAERERFDASDWAKPPSQGGGGREKRVLVLALDRLLSMKQMEELVAAQGARRLLSCGDQTCCAHGFDDTLKDTKAHYIAQRVKQLQRLSQVPESRRVSHFLASDLATAEQSSHRATKLKVQNASLREMLVENYERIRRMRPVFNDLSKQMDGAHSTPKPVRRPYPPRAVSSRGR